MDATLRAVGAPSTSTGYDTLAQIFGSPELKGLSPGQVAQIEWYVDTKAIQAGQTVPASGYHAFLIGRHATGTWYLSDQGNQPPLVLQASDLPDLRAALDAASASKRSWLDTRSTTQRRQLTWTGVRVFDKPDSIDTRHRRILPPGQDLGMLDPPGWGRDIRMVTWDWVGTASSLGAARALFGSTGVGHGFVIAEMPAGMFNVAKTNPVATSAFEGTFAPSGLLVQSPNLGHCWLQLANADSSRRELLQVR